MPVAYFDTGALTTSSDVGGRTLIPGVTPGGQFAGKNKPALLIRDAWIEQVVDIVDAGVAADFERVMVFLKLSQELDLTPGLLLPVTNLVIQKTATAQL